MESTKIILIMFFSSLFFTINPVSSQNQEEIDEEILDQQLESLIEYFELAEELMEEEDFEKAIEFYDKVLEIDETDIDALNGKATALDNLGQHEQAIELYDKVLEIDETDIDALNGKATALDNLGQHEQAIELYDKVLEIDQTDIDALNGRALALEGLGRLEEAISNLEKIVELAPPETIEEVSIPEPQEQPIAENEETTEIDQTLIVIVSTFVVILGTVIVIDFITRKKKNAIHKASEQAQKTERKYSDE
jgi:tetratricopeptide (TPR) repeat protein